MTGLILSRIRLKRDASVAALAPLLLPEAGGARMVAGHGLLWSLFADGPDRRRDFLWREDAPGQFMTLSARAPSNPHQLFQIESKDFAPALSPGDRLGFTLRANPVISRSAGPGQRGRRHDVVMDALHSVPRGERAEARPAAVSAAGRAWFDRQGVASGFAAEGEVNVDGYDRISLPREEAAIVPPSLACWT
ncbi:type I-E CRISPR-associated protein Cas6/Cse3/CasE [Pseudoroseomonas wenyumeiae]